jgi:hypothetical protein
LAVQLIIIAPVLELFFDSPADVEPKIRTDRDVAAIKQGVNVTTQEQPIGVPPAFLQDKPFA